MSGLNWLIRDYVESLAGKIVRRGFVYLFLPAPARKQRLRNWRGEEFKPLTDIDGREYAAFKGRGVHCTNPAKWFGLYPRKEHNGNTYCIVPATDCAACEHHEPARRRRFACCLWDREQHKASPTPQQIAADAVKRAESVIAGSEPIL